MHELFVGVDVGGTFTDVFAIDASGDIAGSAKHPTTRPDPTIGIMGALDSLRKPLGGEYEITEITVGSTLALNAVIEEKGARTALLTTDGFLDIIEIGRESRDRLYDLAQPRQRVLIPPELRYPIIERISARGEVLTPLSSDLAQLLAWLDDQQVDAVAICLLNSYCNPIHEEQLRDRLLATRPDLFITASVDVRPQYREYERTLTTVINAYVGPTMIDYLSRLTASVRTFAPGAKVRITDSLGGALNSETARTKPVLTVMSGPAAGVAGATAVTSQMLTGSVDLVGMDMGGTTCDVSVVQGGIADITSTARIGTQQFALRTIDIHSIGAGGGTIAFVDDGGLLRVGPQSTGSFPGPASYGLGGTKATITDAHAVLGHLHPDDLLGGSISIDVQAAQQAIDRNVAGPLNITVAEAAAGIIAVSDASMRRAIEAITVRRGLDPRTFALVSFGGAAPLHAAAIGKAIGMGTIIVPRFGGVLAAMGAAWATEQYEATYNCLVASSGVSVLDLHSWYKELEEKVRDLAHEPPEDSVFGYYADMRFHGQTAVLEVPIPPDTDDPVAAMHQAFIEKYRKMYGYLLDNVESEIESVRVRITLPPSHNAAAPTTGHLTPAKAQPWSAAFDGPTFIDCQRWTIDAQTAPPASVTGPAVIGMPGSTALVHPGQVASFDRYGNLAITAVGEPAS